MAAMPDIVARGRGRLRYANFRIHDTGRIITDLDPETGALSARIEFEVTPEGIRHWHWTYWWMVVRMIMKIH